MFPVMLGLINATTTAGESTTTPPSKLCVFFVYIGPKHVVGWIYIGCEGGKYIWRFLTVDTVEIYFVM